jgi:hypothetical protein
MPKSFFIWVACEKTRPLEILPIRLTNVGWVCNNRNVRRAEVKLDRANKARRDLEARKLAEIMRERNRSGANGTHADKRTRRLKTRRTIKIQALRDWG